MIKKPSFEISKEKRLSKAKKELELEDNESSEKKTKQTTVVLEAELLYAVQEVALKRKREGVEPNTLKGMIKEALKKIVERELKR